jgi:hypothetical protein
LHAELNGFRILDTFDTRYLMLYELVYLFHVVRFLFPLFAWGYSEWS